MNIEELPFCQQENEGFFIRNFSQSLSDEELKWHFDDENRRIIPVSGEGWKLQIDESLPDDLVVGKEYFIPMDVYHRLIKGSGDLVIRLYKLDSKKGDQPTHERKYSQSREFSDYMLYHIKNEIRLQDNVFRYGSDAWCDLIQEAKELYDIGVLELDNDEVKFLEDDPGKIVIKEGKKFVLNTPFRNTDGNGHEFYVDVLEDTGEIKRVYFS